MDTKRSTRMSLLLALLVACVACDQFTKSIATTVLRPKPSQSFLGDTFRLEYAQNPGAFLGMGGNFAPGIRFWGLTVVNGVFLLILAYLLLKNWNMPGVQFAAWGLILAGGIGNLIDRGSQQGFVTDFLNLGIGPVRTGIFNVADMAVTAGFGLFICSWWRDEKAKGELRREGHSH